jgi:hypothetical protein
MIFTTEPGIPSSATLLAAAPKCRMSTQPNFSVKKYLDALVPCEALS